MQDQLIAQSRLRRLNILGVAIFVLGALFLFRLFDRQVLKCDQFKALAQRQYYTTVDKPARRGEIFIKDKNSQNLIDESKSELFPVAVNLELYDVMIVPRHIREIEDKKAVAQALSRLIDISEEEIFGKINVDKWYIPPLKKRISKDEAEAIAAEELKGVYLESHHSRFYPEEEFMAHTLGFVDFEGKGRYGIEEYYDGVLKGEGGVLTGLKDNMGKIIKIKESAPGKDGAGLVLTIERSIQYMVERKLGEGVERFGAEGGSIVIMDPKTGGILAMASHPAYNPNKFNEVKKEDQSIFLNPATAFNWEPGSVFKPVVVAAALDDGKVEPDSIPEEIPGGFKSVVVVDGHEIRNATNEAYGYETVTEILENSDNIGMIWIADKLGNERLGRYLERFELGRKTGIDLAGEASGQLRSYNKWRNVNRATISFGQGIAATPIQIVRAYATIANKGKAPKPHLIEKIVEAESGERRGGGEIGEPERVIGEDTARQLTEMLVSVVEKGHGKRARVEGFRVAGKTGTAQIPKEEGGYEEKEHIGSFAGFAPADDPKFAILVKFDKPKNVDWAEASAAPIFGELADWLLNNYFKLPKTEEQN